MINKIISTCTRKDILTWKITCHSLVEYCKSREKILIVPRRDFYIFKKSTPSEFDIIIENDILDPDVVKKNIDIGSVDRFGWFYQQILKIEAMKIGGPDDINVIWDADTVALRNFNLIKEEKIYYRHFHHHHEAYFTTIKFLLDINKSYDKSFIAQVFPAKVFWIKNMISEIESKFKMPWYLALLSVREPSHKLFFSEYETMGNYIIARYPEAIAFEEIDAWYRGGGGCIKKISDYNFSFLKSQFPNFDYVAVESYDVLEAMSLIERIKYRLLVRLSYLTFLRII
jgi:hypothetical protein